MQRFIYILLFTLILTSCASTKQPSAVTPVTPPPQTTIPAQPRVMSPAMVSELEQGKRLFQDGFYKRAMEQLLPIAAEGSMEAQYAVGYMYYYGFGVPQDTASGGFWIRRAADQHYEPAIKALLLMRKQESKYGKQNAPSFQPKPRGLSAHTP